MRELRTERLRLRAWRARDLDALAALNADERVMRHVAPNRPLTRAETERQLEQIVGHWDEHGFGLWAAEPHAAVGGEEAMIGFVGLAVPSFLPDVLPAVEVGWRLAPAWWGRGLATEGARAGIGHAFAELGLARVVSIIEPANAASLRVAAKLGMRRGADRLHPATRRRLCVLELDAA